MDTHTARRSVAAQITRALAQYVDLVAREYSAVYGHRTPQPTALTSSLVLTAVIFQAQVAALRD